MEGRREKVMMSRIRCFNQISTLQINHTVNKDKCWYFTSKSTTIYSRNIARNLFTRFQFQENIARSLWWLSLLYSFGIASIFSLLINLAFCFYFGKRKRKGIPFSYTISFWWFSSMKYGDWCRFKRKTWITSSFFFLLFLFLFTVATKSRFLMFNNFTLRRIKYLAQMPQSYKITNIISEKC